MKCKKYSRENDCNTMIELVKNKEDYKEISEKGLVILLNGSWGSGKTTFINDLIEKINKENDIDLFNYYNAYEYDYYDNAYIPFFASIQNKIKLHKELYRTISNIGNESKKSIIAVGYNLVRRHVKKEFDIDLNNIKESLQELEKEENEKNVLEHFNNVCTLKKEIKKQFNKISENRMQIFIIDELDRCKPSFAMDTLEIVKHFFDLDNCIFIIAVDKIQLEESMKSIYGIGIDGEKYFSKLFDYQFNLLPVPIEKIMNVETSSQIDVVRGTYKLLQSLNISIRDSKKIYNELFSKLKYCDNVEQGIFLGFLLILKYTDLSFYNELFNIKYLEWKEKFKNIEDLRLSKYNNALDMKVGNLDLRLLLEETIFNLDNTFFKLETNNGNDFVSLSIFSKKIAQISNDILDYVCCTDTSKTVGENIKIIVG